MLYIPTPTSDITVFFVVPLFVFERACVLVCGKAALPGLLK